jgi:hypothetical protein
MLIAISTAQASSELTWGKLLIGVLTILVGNALLDWYRTRSKAIRLKEALLVHCAETLRAWGQN